jgi:hypothetical protein
MYHSKDNKRPMSKSNSFWEELLALVAAMFAIDFFENSQKYSNEEITEEECELWDFFQ